MAALDAEDVKEIIVAADQRFYTIPSANHSATYTKLYFRLPGHSYDYDRVLKVDILVPPTLRIPWVRYSQISYIDDIPVMPLFPLLVLKLQGWWDHRRSSRTDFQAKQQADIHDIRGLVDQARATGVHLSDETDWDPDFLTHAEQLVAKFMTINGFKRSFRRLGFNV